MKSITYFIIALFLFSIGCKKDGDPDITPPPPTGRFNPTPYFLNLPAHFSLIGAPDIPKDNPLTEEGVALGRMLYYEQKLSKGGPMEGKSCSSCHHQNSSFSIPDAIPNFNNVMPHFNLAWTKQFLWEGGVSGTLEDIMMFEVRDFFKADLSQIRTDAEYKKRFKAAFNVDTIKEREVTYALAQFMRTMISGNSRFDNFIKIFFSDEEVIGPTLTNQERRGLDWFMAEGKGDCFHCHGDLTNPLLTDNAFKNNGLDINPDSGLAKTTKNPWDIGKFKTPSLRNLVFTAPYMHDGRYTTLEEVVDFYADNVKESSPNIDGTMLKTRELTSSERADLVAFLKAITDSSYTTNLAFSRP